MASKVHFTKNAADLEKFIDRSNIIKELGGDDAWTYHYVEPKPGENKSLLDVASRARLLDERAALVKDYEHTTQEWIRDAESRDILQKKRSELTERLRTGYWELDPYIRARTLYDRTGMVLDYGRVQFYGTSINNSSSHAADQKSPLPPGHDADDLD